MPSALPTLPPHAGQPVAEAGAPLGQAPAVVIMVHGRNAAPANILDLGRRFERPDLTYLAPAAKGGTWYPFGFMSEIETNEPGLTSGLGVLNSLVNRVEEAGIDRSRIVLAGFSQGACLTSEFVIRNPSRYGGVLIFTGGAIGPAGTIWNREGDLEGTPVFLGCSDRDAHVPESRARETAEAMTRLGGSVTLRIYPGMGHIVNDDEIAEAQTMLDAVSA